MTQHITGADAGYALRSASAVHITVGGGSAYYVRRPDNIMRHLKLKPDETARRLRWLMLWAMLFDAGLTLFGQPSSYWYQPETVLERNAVFHFFFSQGPAVAILIILIYCSAGFLAASILPRRWALSVIVFFVLVHFFGACTWLDYHWRFGTKASAFYGIPLSVMFVWLAFPAPKVRSKA